MLTNIGVEGSKVRDALRAKQAELEAGVVAERLRMADEVLLGDDKEMKKFERHRAMLSRQLDVELGRLKTLRELAQGGSGSFCGAILVELRVVGGRA